MSTLAQQVLARVAASLGGASPASVMAGKRNKWACRIRHATMLALRRRGLSFPKIAQMLGGMDHTTVMHGCEKAALLELKDEAVCAALTAEARLMADEELADRLKRLHRQQAAELRTLGRTRSPPPPRPSILVLAGASYIEGWVARAEALGVRVDAPLAGMTLGARRSFARRFVAETPSWCDVTWEQLFGFVNALDMEVALDDLPGPGPMPQLTLGLESGSYV